MTLPHLPVKLVELIGLDRTVSIDETDVSSPGLLKAL
jgi:hypothetical protein